LLASVLCCNYNLSLRCAVGESPTATGGSPVLPTAFGHGNEIAGLEGGEMGDRLKAGLRTKRTQATSGSAGWLSSFTVSPERNCPRPLIGQFNPRVIQDGAGKGSVVSHAGDWRGSVGHGGRIACRRGLSTGPVRLGRRWFEHPGSGSLPAIGRWRGGVGRRGLLDETPPGRTGGAENEDGGGGQSNPFGGTQFNKFHGV
jgi:hypothetical protein